MIMVVSWYRVIMIMIVSNCDWGLHVTCLTYLGNDRDPVAIAGWRRDSWDRSSQTPNGSFYPLGLAGLVLG